MLHRYFLGIIVIGWVFALFLTHVPVNAERGKMSGVIADQDVVPDELLVAIQPGYMPYLRLSALSATATGISELDRINRSLRVRSIQPLLGPEFGYTTARRGSSGLERVFVIKLPPGSDLDAALQLFRRQNFIEYAEPNHVYRALDFIPNDPLWRYQWALPKIQLPQAWEISQGRSDRVIAVLDTGVDYRHPDLAGKVLKDKDRDFVNDDSDAMDDHGHGTHVAGIAAAATNNEVGVAGVCPQCRILPIKVLDREGSGNDKTVAQGIRYAVDQGAPIINLSLGGPDCSQTLAQAINEAFDRGVLIIAASGNNGSKTLMAYPARSPRVVSVGAVDQNDVEASFSQRDETLDLLAPGVDIVSTVINNSEYGYLSGTSMAAPHVAGVAGLLWSQNPGWRNTEVWWALRYTYSISAGSLAIGESPWRLYLPLVANSRVARLNAYRALQVTSPGQVEAPVDTCAN